MNVTARGLTQRGIEMRNVRIDRGRWFRTGHREVVIGKSIAGRHPNANLGKTFRFGKGEWQVVGVMDGGQSALDNEIWGDLNQISSDFNRTDSLSSVLLRASDAAAVIPLVNSINDDRRLNASAITERAYYDSQTAAGAPLQFLGILFPGPHPHQFSDRVVAAIACGRLARVPDCVSTELHRRQRREHGYVQRNHLWVPRGLRRHVLRHRVRSPDGRNWRLLSRNQCCAQGGSDRAAGDLIL